MTDEVPLPTNQEPPSDAAIDRGVVLPDPTIGTAVVDGKATAAETMYPLPGPSVLSAIGWTLAFLLGQVLVTVLITVPAAVLLVVVGTPQQEMINTLTRWSVPIGTFGSVATAAALSAVKFGTAAHRCLGLRWPDAVQLFTVVLFVTPLWVAGSGLGDLVDHWFRLEIDPQVEAIKQLALTGWFGIIIAGSLFPALGEEIFFRGFLGRGLVARYGAVGGTLLTSLVFGLFHLSPAQIAGTFVIGLGLHTMYLTSKSLPAAMVLHFLINLQGLGSMALRARTHSSTITESAEFTGFGGATVGWSVAAVGLIGLLLYHLRTTWVFAPENVWPAIYVTGETPPVAAIPIRDSIAQHWRLVATTCLVWLCFMVGFVRSGVFG